MFEYIVFVNHEALRAVIGPSVYTKKNTIASMSYWFCKPARQARFYAHRLLIRPFHLRGERDRVTVFAVPERVAYIMRRNFLQASITLTYWPDTIHCQPLSSKFPSSVYVLA